MRYGVKFVIKRIDGRNVRVAQLYEKKTFRVGWDKKIPSLKDRIASERVMREELHHKKPSRKELLELRAEAIRKRQVRQGEAPADESGDLNKLQESQSPSYPTEKHINERVEFAYSHKKEDRKKSAERAKLKKVSTDKIRLTESYQAILADEKAKNPDMPETQLEHIAIHRYIEENGGTVSYKETSMSHNMRLIQRRFDGIGNDPARRRKKEIESKLETVGELTGLGTIAEDGEVEREEFTAQRFVKEAMNRLNKNGEIKYSLTPEQKAKIGIPFTPEMTASVNNILEHAELSKRYRNAFSMDDRTLKRIFHLNFRLEEGREAVNYNLSLVKKAENDPKAFLMDCVDSILAFDTTLLQKKDTESILKVMAEHGSEYQLAFSLPDILAAMEAHNLVLPSDKMNALYEKFTAVNAVNSLFSGTRDAYMSPMSKVIQPELLTFDVCTEMAGWFSEHANMFEGNELTDWVNYMVKASNLVGGKDLLEKHISLVDQYHQLGILGEEGKHMSAFVKKADGSLKPCDPLDLLGHPENRVEMYFTSPDWEEAKHVTYDQDGHMLVTPEQKTPFLADADRNTQFRDWLLTPEGLNEYAKQIHTMATALHATDKWYVWTNTEHYTNLNTSLQALDKTLQDMASGKTEFDIKLIEQQSKALENESKSYSEYKTARNERELANNKKLSNRSRDRVAIADIINHIVRHEDFPRVDIQLSSEIAGTVVQDINEFVRTKGVEKAKTLGAEADMTKSVKFLTSDPEHMKLSGLDSSDLHQARESMEKIQGAPSGPEAGIDDMQLSAKADKTEPERQTLGVK